jgi:hypothetical protein
MDPTEKHVHAHLIARGLQDVVFEPEPNDPPDFLVNGRIAVEARRLNQNEELPGGEHRGLEEQSFPLRGRFKSFLATFGPATAGESWFVHYDFRRPLAPWKELEPPLRKILEAFRVAPGLGREFSVGPRFRVRVLRAQRLHPTLFLLADDIDHDEGGWLLAEMLKNIPLCVAEKTAKVARVRARYPEWWLALVDRIGYELSTGDALELQQLVPRDKAWDKVIIVSATDPGKFVELI